MHLKRFLGIVLAMMMLFAISLGSGYAQDNNLLQNPDFEDGFHSDANFPSQVADAWEAWSAAGSEFKPFYISIADASNNGFPARVNTGSEAQVYYSSFATHDAGIYQQVANLTPGTEYVFSIYAYIFSNNDPTNLDTSDQPGDVTIQVGIDPSGGTDPAGPNVVYSDAMTNYDSYRQYSVSATATADTVTVFVHTTVKETVINTIIYLDTASLTAMPMAEQATEEATVEPAVTEEASVEPVMTEEATAEPIVTEEATELASVEPVVTEAPTEEVTVEPVMTEEATVEAVITEEATATEEVVATEEATQEAAPTEESISETYPEQITYTVQRGDNVNNIAIRFGSSIAAILQANSLDESALIFVGQVLVVPVKEVPAATTENQQTGTGEQTAQSGGNYANTEVYVVKPGDTLSGIARSYNTTVGAIIQLNGISNANRIAVGQVLHIPVDNKAQTQYSQDNKGANDYTAPEKGQTDNNYHKPNYGHDGQLLYVVQPGDNLYRISIKFDVSLVKLAEINHISNYQLVFVGQTLVIPND